MERKCLGVGLLGSSRVVISGVISRAAIVVAHSRGLKTILITTHEPPSKRLCHRLHKLALSRRAAGVRTLKCNARSLCQGLGV